MRVALRVLGLVMVAGGVPLAAAQPTPARERVAARLAEAVYADEFLLEPARASDLYRQILDDPAATRRDRQVAAWRLARAQRRLNRPAAARGQLGALLLDPELPSDLRRRAEQELRLIPRAEPSRLLSAGTLVYLEVPQPGIFVERVLGMLRDADLDRAVGRALFGPLRRLGPLPRFGMLDIRAIWNPGLREELSKLDALGVGWHDFRFGPSALDAEAASDMVFVLHTGGSDAAAGVLEGLISGLLTPPPQDTSLRLFTAGAGLIPGLQTFSTDGLFVMCSESADGVAALQRRGGPPGDDALGATPEFRRRPADWPAPDAAMLFVDWRRLLEQVLLSYGPAEAEQLSRTAELLGLADVGPLFIQAAVRQDRLEAEAVVSVVEPPGTLIQLLQTPPLTEGWQAWIPDAASFALTVNVAPGDQRWRRFEQWIDALRALGPSPAAQPAEPALLDWRAQLAVFEQQSGISIAEDVCRDLQTLTLVALPSPGPRTASRWILVAELDEPHAWLRRLEQRLQRWWSGGAASQRLPLSRVATSIGDVTQLPVPGTLGLAWQVRGRRIVASIGVDALVQYVAALPGQATPRPDLGPPQPVSKYLRLRLSRGLARGAGPGAPLGSGYPPPPPLEAWTFEQSNRTHAVLIQPAATETSRWIATEWFDVMPGSSPFVPPPARGGP
jgi:hypothetical protein